MVAEPPRSENGTGQPVVACSDSAALSGRAPQRERAVYILAFAKWAGSLHRCVCRGAKLNFPATFGLASNAERGVWACSRVDDGGTGNRCDPRGLPAAECSAVEFTCLPLP